MAKKRNNSSLIRGKFVSLCRVNQYKSITNYILGSSTPVVDDKEWKADAYKDTRPAPLAKAALL